MQALQLHWYQVLAAVILFAIWTALQLLMKPKQEDEPEPEYPEPIDIDAYPEVPGRADRRNIAAETIRF